MVLLQRPKQNREESVWAGRGSARERRDNREQKKREKKRLCFVNSGTCSFLNVIICSLRPKCHMATFGLWLDLSASAIGQSLCQKCPDEAHFLLNWSWVSISFQFFFTLLNCRLNGAYGKECPKKIFEMLWKCFSQCFKLDINCTFLLIYSSYIEDSTWFK